MSEQGGLPPAFVSLRHEGNRSFGCSHFDAGVAIQHCASCGAENVGALVRYPEALYHSMDELLDGASEAASLATRQPLPCLSCGAPVPARGRVFIYAHYACRLGKDLLLLLRTGVRPRCSKAFLLGADGDTVNLSVPLGLRELDAEMFHPAVVAYREAYASFCLHNQPEQALGLLVKAADSDPDFCSAHTLRAEILIGYGRVDEAVPVVARALELDPEDPEANLHKGRLEIAAGRPLDARPHLEQAASCSRTASAAHYRLGLIAEHDGKPDEARNAYEEAIRLDPDNDAAQQRLDGLAQGIQWRFFRCSKEDG
jgi:tetratricopeptide (TPR) repeat protein